MSSEEKSRWHNGKKVRNPRTMFTEDQIQFLESVFQKMPYLSLPELERLASDLGLTSLRTSPSGTLVWLERSLSGDLYPGPHRASLRLMSLDSVNGEIREVVSEQQSEFTTEARSPFAGLFNPSISPRPWVDNVTLALRY